MAARILIADDSTTVRRVVVQSLEAEGHEVIAVSDGDEAFTRVCELRPDLVLADVLMPGRSGYELAEAIEADDRVRGTPVLLLSGAFEPFDEVRAESCGARDHLTKPFQSATLLEQVHRALAREDEGASNTGGAEEGGRAAPDEDLLGVFESTGPLEGEAPTPFEGESANEPLSLGEQEAGTSGGVGEERAHPEASQVALPGEAGFSVVPPSSPWRRADTRRAAGTGEEAAEAEEMRRQVARKVEQLAPEIIREVAWEVVPDLLERLLREAADRPPAPKDRDDAGEDRR